MKRIPNAEINDPDGKPLRLQFDQALEQATVGNMIRGLCIQLGHRTQMTMLDAQQGLRVIRKVNEANGFIELDPGDFKWVCERVDQIAPQIYGVSAALLREQLDAATDSPEASAG